MQMDGKRSGSHLPENHSSRGSENANEAENDTLFVNYAEIAWHEMRRAWKGDKSHRSKQREQTMSLDLTYEELLTLKEPFAEPIPLSEMVDFLVDFWLHDGLYD